MRLKKNTFECLKHLSTSGKFDYFFDNLKKPESPIESKLIDELADLFITEFELDWDDHDKIRFFIRLGFLANEPQE